jgi:Pao retrotransposon peptidase
VEWDEESLRNKAEEWITIRDEMKKVSKFEIKRRVAVNSESVTIVKMFCDASEKAYGAAIYIAEGSQQDLVIAKGKVTPRKFTTTPKLELMAAALRSLLLTRVISELSHRTKKVNCCCFTYSSAVVDWLKSDPRKRSSFVANRIALTQEQSAEWEWGHYISEQNPADHITKGIEV